VGFGGDTGRCLRRVVGRYGEGVGLDQTDRGGLADAVRPISAACPALARSLDRLVYFGICRKLKASILAVAVIDAVAYTRDPECTRPYQASARTGTVPGSLTGTLGTEIECVRQPWNIVRR
jgi:hypothetical protein